MKWVALAIFAVLGAALIPWLRTDPRRAPFVWGLLGFLPFVLSPWHLLVAPYSTPGWSGYVYGWEIGLIDVVALAIILSTKGSRSDRALLGLFSLYLFFVLIAVFQAAYPKLALSYPIQLSRALLVFLAVSRIAQKERGEQAVLSGLVIGLCVQAGYAIVARAGGALQTGGSLAHQNLLGFASHLVLMPALAIFLAGRWPKIGLLGAVGGITAVILTASRASIGLSAFGLVLTMILSIGLRFSARKAISGVVGMLLLIGAYPFAQRSLEARLKTHTNVFFSEDAERAAFKRAAYAMLADMPMGVGPNHYVYVANIKGYSARAGVAWRTASRSTNVHNSYLLAAVETGYFGAASLLLLIGGSIWAAFSTAIRYKRHQGAEVLIGVGCGLVAMSIHGLFEWMFVVNPTQYLFAVSLGLISGLRIRFHKAASAGRGRSKSPQCVQAELAGNGA